MRRRTRYWLSLLPLLACVLAAFTPSPALRGQSHSSNRSRVQRPARSGGVRLEGDHHHDETPQFLVPREQGLQDQADAPPAILTAEIIWQMPPAAGLAAAEEFPSRAAGAQRSTPPQRGPPSFLL